MEDSLRHGASQHAGDLIRQAQERGFAYSCDPDVGRLLAVLAASIPVGGRVLEIGTGAGLGAAWMVGGLHPRTDVTLTTIEYDAAQAAEARQGDWPAYVDFRVGDALALLPTLGTFDLIFADAGAGKQEGLDLTIAALNPRGVLVVDDMVPPEGTSWPEDFRLKQEAVRHTLLTHERLVAVELAHGSGVILATAR